MSNVVEVIFRGVDQISRTTAQIQRSIETVGQVALSVGKGLLAFFAVDKIIAFGQAVVRTSDAMTELNNVLGQTTRSNEHFVNLQQRLLQASTSTDTAFKSTVELYTRLTQATKNLGITEEQRVSTVETLNRVMKLAGPLSGDIAAEFNRLLITGELSGRSLVQLFTRAPRLAKALSDELHVSMAELKRMGEEGKLSVETVLDVLSKQSGNIKKDFEGTTKTVGDSLKNLGTALGALITDLDKKVGFTTVLAKGLESLAGKILDAATRTPAEALRELIDVQQRMEDLQARINSLSVNQTDDKERERLGRRLQILAVQERELIAEQKRFEKEREASAAAKKADEEVAAANKRAAEAAAARAREWQAFLDSMFKATAEMKRFYGAIIDVNEVWKDNTTLQEINFKKMGNVIIITAERIEDKTKEAAKKMNAAWDQAIRNIQSALADQLFNGFEDGLRGMLKAFTDVVRRMVAEALAARLVEKLLGKSKDGEGDGKTTVLGKILGTIFGKKNPEENPEGRASGGWTTPGALYSVNEQEPEFLVSGDRSRVVPLSKAAANGYPAQRGSVFAPQTNVNVSSVITASELEDLLRRRDAMTMAKFRQFLLDGGLA